MNVTVLHLVLMRNLLKKNTVI